MFLVGTKPNVACAVYDEKGDAIEWIVQLGYLNRKHINLMNQKNAITGLEFNIDADCPPCDTCTAGKITRSLKLSTRTYVAPWEGKSIGGAQYLMLLDFMDDYSRWTKYYLLRNKSKITSRFLEDVWFASWKNQAHAIGWRLLILPKTIGLLNAKTKHWLNRRVECWLILGCLHRAGKRPSQLRATHIIGVSVN